MQYLIHAATPFQRDEADCPSSTSSMALYKDRLVTSISSSTHSLAVS